MRRRPKPKRSPGENKGSLRSCSWTKKWIVCYIDGRKPSSSGSALFTLVLTHVTWYPGTSSKPRSLPANADSEKRKPPLPARFFKTKQKPPRTRKSIPHRKRQRRPRNPCPFHQYEAKSQVYTIDNAIRALSLSPNRLQLQAYTIFHPRGPNRMSTQPTTPSSP